MTSTGRAEWPAFGTTAVLCTTDAAQLGAARDAVVRTLAAIDGACNRFDPSSELSHVNAISGRRVRISSLLAEVLRVALDAAEATDGAVDPTVGTSLEAAGYDRDFEAIEDSAAHAAFVPAAGWRCVELDVDGGSVRVPAGVVLDVGSTGKALAVDMAAQAAHAATGGGVLFSLGGDLAVRGEAPGDGWPVHVTDDHGAGASAPGQTVLVKSGALATSSTLVRRWRRRDDVHHIIDPATGRPARELWCTVSVTAPTCAGANAHATAAIVRGEAASERLAEMRLPARLRAASGEVRYVAGWPATGDSACGPGI